MTLTFTSLAGTFWNFGLWSFTNRLLCFKTLPNIFGTNLQNYLWFMFRKTATTLKWLASGWPTPVDSCTVWNNTAVMRWGNKWHKRVEGRLGHSLQSFLFLFRHLWHRTQANRTNTVWRTLTWRSTGRCWVTFPSRSISSSSRWLKDSYSPWSVSYAGHSAFSLWSFEPEPFASKSYSLCIVSLFSQQ